MKKITFLLIMLMLATAGIMAQQRGPRGQRPNMAPEERAKQMTERMTKAYSLTDEQAEKVSALNLELVQKMTPPARGESAGKATRREASPVREAMRANREAYDAKLKEILTSEQYESYTKERPRRE